MKKIALLALIAAATSLMAANPASYTKCASCHGQAGEKVALGKSAPMTSLTKAEIVSSLEGYKAGTLNKHGMGAVMKGQAAALTPAQIKEIAEAFGK